jgi:hypothetical protein
MLRLSQPSNDRRRQFAPSRTSHPRVRRELCAVLLRGSASVSHPAALQRGGAEWSKKSMLLSPEWILTMLASCPLAQRATPDGSFYRRLQGLSCDFDAISGRLTKTSRFQSSQRLNSYISGQSGSTVTYSKRVWNLPLQKKVSRHLERGFRSLRKARCKSGVSYRTLPFFSKARIQAAPPVRIHVDLLAELVSAEPTTFPRALGCVVPFPFSRPISDSLQKAVKVKQMRRPVVRLTD